MKPLTDKYSNGVQMYHLRQSNMKTFEFTYSRDGITDSTFSVNTYTFDKAEQIAVLLVSDKYQVSPTLVYKHLTLTSQVDWK